MAHYLLPKKSAPQSLRLPICGLTLMIFYAEVMSCRFVGLWSERMAA